MAQRCHGSASGNGERRREREHIDDDQAILHIGEEDRADGPVFEAYANIALEQMGRRSPPSHSRSVVRR